MKRNLVTINDLWQEYDVGLSGNPSIKSLEEEFGTKWRKSRTESKFFSTRLIVYKEVQKISRDDCISTEEAAKKLERRRVDLKVSIDKLIKLIKASAL
ncbi:transcriptional activator of glycolytic enzymes-domain-containing protein [Thamnidium elegans]|nr:transcriptional activator of glycolytic enzymes-domain-containing protein [Thamnidium elegans]